MKHAYFYYNGTNGFYGRDNEKRVDSIDYVPFADVEPLISALKFAKDSIVNCRTLDEARNDRALNEAMVAIENRISAALAKASA